MQETFSVDIKLKTSRTEHADFILKHMTELVTLLYPNNVVEINTTNTTNTTDSMCACGSFPNSPGSTGNRIMWCSETDVEACPWGSTARSSGDQSS